MPTEPDSAMDRIVEEAVWANGLNHFWATSLEIGIARAAAAAAVKATTELFHKWKCLCHSSYTDRGRHENHCAQCFAEDAIAAIRTAFPDCFPDQP